MSGLNRTPDGRDLEHGRVTACRTGLRAWRAEGYPAQAGLFYPGVLARDRDHRDTKVIGERWLRENVRWTYQDQLSLPYVLWKLNITPSTFPHDLGENPWVRRGTHTHARGRP